MYALWSENAKYWFYRKVHKYCFLVTNSFQPNIERLEMCSANAFHIFIVESMGAANLNCWVEFQILGHPWDRLVYCLHDKL